MNRHASAGWRKSKVDKSCSERRRSPLGKTRTRKWTTRPRHRGDPWVRGVTALSPSGRTLQRALAALINDEWPLTDIRRHPRQIVLLHWYWRGVFVESKFFRHLFCLFSPTTAEAHTYRRSERCIPRISPWAFAAAHISAGLFAFLTLIPFRTTFSWPLWAIQDYTSYPVVMANHDRISNRP